MRKNINKLATLVMTGALAATMSFSAFAQTVEQLPADFVGKTVEVAKTVTTDPSNKTSAPYTKFDLTVGEGVVEGKNNVSNVTGLEIYKGNAIQAGKILVTKADFTDSNKYTVMDGNAGYKSKFTVSVPDNAFEAPGVYSFTLQEVEGSYSGVKYDTTKYNMFVFVENAKDKEGKYIIENGKNKLVVTGIVVSDPTTGNKIGGGSDNDMTGITNNFGYEGTKEDPIPDGDTTHDITIGKTVVGNTANFSKEFTFVVSVAPIGNDENVASVNQKFTLTYADGTTQPLEFAADGKTHQVAIKNGQTAKINGLTKDYVVSVYEEEEGADGYTTTYNTTASTTDDSTTATNLTSKKNADGTTEYDTVKLTVSADEATLGITNTRENTIPTGVAMDVAPYALMVALAGGAAATFLRKKESFED